VLAELHPGAVVVLHAGRPWHAGTAAALEGMVSSIRERGYEIVPVTRMLAAAGYTVSAR
jgi:peptidoglycan/xylan/chitin deacetylase (PgdA/CDA1 family)